MEDEVGEVGGDVKEGGGEGLCIYMALHNVTNCTKASGFVLAGMLQNARRSLR